MRGLIFFLIVVLVVGGVYLVLNNLSQVETVIELLPEMNVISGDLHKTYVDIDTYVDDDDVIYMPMSDLEDLFEIYIDYDEATDTVIIIANDDFITIKDERVTVNENEYSGAKVKITNNDVLIPISFFKEMFNIEIFRTTTNESVLVINLNHDYTTAKSSTQTELLSSEELAIDTISKDEDLFILGEEGDYYNVISSGLINGKVLKSAVTSKTVIKGVFKDTRITLDKEGRLFMTWEQVNKTSPDIDSIPDMPGLNVISPTWLGLESGDGTISRYYSEKYDGFTKKMNYDLWVLVDNSFDPSMTSELINSYDNRTRFIDGVIGYCLDRSIKGINIDFENVYLRDKDKLVQLIAELTSRAHKEGIIVSMDVTVPGGSDNWSKVYDRRRLGNILDYLVIMTYDQYWSSSPVSGTVSGVTWVDENMELLTTIVDHEKLVLGIPLYTRIWTETPSQEVANKMDAKSRSVFMYAGERIADEKGLTRIWDEVNGQYFVSYIEDGKLIKIWLEEERSISLKADLVNKYDLAGVACWRRGFEKDGIWEVINQIIN